MSHSFYIGGVGDASLSQTLEALPFDNLVAEPQSPNGGWPEIAHIYQDNVSVRSIETAMEGGTLQVRIMAYSSTEDFALAAAIADHVATQFGKQIEPEDNESMSVDRWREEYGPEWQREQARTYLQMLVSMYCDSDRHDGVMRMWGTRQEFLVGPRLMGPLLEDPENFTTNFFDRVRRLNYLDREDVFGPSVMAAREEGSGKQAVFSVLGEDVPTALSSQAAFIVLNHAGLGSDREDGGQTILTFEDFADIAADSLTWLGDSIALTPAYKGDAWQQILDDAAAKQTGLFDHPELLRDPEDDDSGSASSSANADGPHGISDEQWEVLGHAVVAVFLLIAGADGNVDKKEVQAFQKKLIEGLVGIGECEIMPVAFMKAAAGLEQRLGDISQMEGENIAALVVASRQVVEAAAGSEKAATFSKALYDMAESVAMASGGGFLGLGSKIGKEEKAVLSVIRQLLQLDS